MPEVMRIVKLLDDYKAARERDAEVGEADNAGNVAGDVLYQELREDIDKMLKSNPSIPFAASSE